jgi:hypothetical protein
MKKLIYAFISILFCSCGGWTRIASLTSVSTRNFERSVEYVELKKYVDSRHAKELSGFIKKSEGTDPLNKQIIKCVSSVDGGEFMKNVTVFTKKNKVRIMGDVWGIAPSEKIIEKKPFIAPELYGFGTGDSVKWRYLGKTITGIIVGFEGEKVVVKYRKNDTDIFDKMAYSELTKMD